MGEMAENGLDIQKALSRAKFEAAKSRGASVKGGFGRSKRQNIPAGSSTK
jgi:hypothetical protein